MKITKIKTKAGACSTITNSELEKIIERLQADSTYSAAKAVAHDTMTARLLAEQGETGYRPESLDRLPYLIFSAALGKGGTDDVKATTGLLLFTIECPEGHSQVLEMQKKVAQMPYTLLAFAGVSGVTLKVVVRIRCDEHMPKEGYQALLSDARQGATRLYGAMLGCSIRSEELTLVSGCRMGYDAHPYYKPDAEPMPVISTEADPLKPYEGTRVEDDGEVVWHPEYEDRERMKLEYQVCVSKALDEEGHDMERCVQLLADYCAKARLGEEACVVRTQWQRRFRHVGDDLVRKIFRNAYKKPYKGRTLSQMNEKERIIRSIENFLARRYQLRFNVVKQLVEFRPNDQRFRPWQPLGDRQLKSIVVEEMKEGGESWMNDIRTFIESSHVADYNPIHEFLAGCGEWDGAHNYIEDFARRLPTSYEHWPKYFHRWLLALVAQALDINRDHGNSMVPMLIGSQGIKKSTFCKNILPPSLREYYMDDIKMDNAEQVERVLGRMWLVCIDEYNAKTEREQAKIKRLLTEKDVQIRKMRSDQYTMTPRLCSFIATTNDTTPLPSGDGSRRYLCVEVTGPADMSGNIPYKQMFAQAVSELRQRDCVYWFTSEDEQEIQRHNQRYQQQSTPELLLSDLFCPCEEHTRDHFWRVTDILKELSKYLKSSDIPSLSKLGRAIKQMGWRCHAIKGSRGYYLTLREGAR